MRDEGNTDGAYGGRPAQEQPSNYKLVGTKPRGTESE